MGEYRYAHICRNGHVLTSKAASPSISAVKFCQTCGAPALTKCVHCQTAIRGEFSPDQFVIFNSNYPRPAYCHNCGLPYPWTESALEAMKEIIWEDEDLFDDEKERMSQSLPDLITETPKTELAIMRVKKFALRATKGVGSALLSFVIEHGCEKAVTALGALMP